LHDVGAAARNQAEFVARALPEADPQAVANMELLGFDALVVKDDLAGREHAVHVGQDQFNILAPPVDFHALLREPPPHVVTTVRFFSPRVFASGSLASRGPSGARAERASGKSATTSVMSSNPAGRPRRSMTGNSLILRSAITVTASSIIDP